MKKSEIISNNYYNAEGTKSFYKGTSFRVNKWAPDTYYFNDDQYVDWVIYNGVLCICERTHVSNMDNAPSIIYENKIPIGIESNPCWNFALGGLSAFTEDAYSDTTRIKISDEKLYISNDNGKTWEYVGNVGSPIDPEQTSVTAEVVSVYESDTPSASVVVNNNHLQFSFALVKGQDGYSGKDGTDGKDGITPKFKIENKYWYVSYDNGSTWEQVGKATGEDGKDGDTPEVDLYKNQYIFIRTQIPVNDFSLTPDDYQSDTNYQNDDYLPSYIYTDDEGKQQTLSWTKFATTVDETWEYQYWSYREKIGGIWGPYQNAALLNNYNTGEGGSAGIVPKVAYTSFVFCRSHKLVTDTDTSPTGGSYEKPHPTSNGTIGSEMIDEWYDAIPAGEGLVYMSTCEFNNETDYDTETAKWSKPVSLADTSDFQIEYSAKEIPNKPSSLQNYYDNDPINFESNWREDNQDWIDYDNSNIHNAIWMATATMHNNIWSDWSIVKIKGETGADGTPIHIVGSAETYADLPACNDSNLQIGDTYTVKTYIDDSGVEVHNVLFTYSGDDDNCWIYLGPIEGTGAYVHIKYATAPYNDNTKNEFDENGIWKYFTKVEDETPGETPGDYIGIYSDSNPNDSLDPSLYTWKRWKGEDGWNYEYVYKLTNTKDAPRVPDISENYSNFVPDGWSDDPQEISKDNPYCWMVYRHKDYDESTLSYIWSSWIGSVNNKEYAALWAHYGQDGLDGPGVEYIYYLSASDTTTWGGEVSLPGNEWEFDKPQDPWKDDPQGVSKDNPVEWVCQRVFNGISWEDWSSPAVFSHYGRDGHDGATVEYVYILDDTIYDDTIIPDHIKHITNLPPVQSPDYKPNYTLDKEYQWFDNFIRPTIVKPYLWCSIRRYEWSEENQTMLWSKFETPFLWTSYTKSITSLRIKVWKRFNTEVNDNVIKPSLTYNLTNNHIEFIEDNGWTISESSTDTGRYLYSLSVFVSGYSSDIITVNEGDWTTLILESVNGIDGSGQSESYISTDPDAILVNVDDNNIVTLGGSYEITSGYYYGNALMSSSISISSAIGNITYTNAADQQHDFTISIEAGMEIMRSIPVKITLTPSDTSLIPLTDTIYITPIKSNDTWDIDTNVSQVICYKDMTPVTITAKILKNGKEYSGDDAKLEYTWDGDTKDWPVEGLPIGYDNYTDIPNTLLIILKVNEATILHKTISIIKDGEKGDTGIGIKQVHEYYLWTEIGSGSNFKADKFKEAVKNSKYSDTITLTSTFNGEEITETWTKKIETIDPTKPCLWNVEVIQYDNNDVQATDPALISQSGRGIKEVIEYYLVSDKNTGITTGTDGWDEKPQTVDKNHPYLWNYEQINFTDETSITTDPVIIGVYSEGADGVGVSNIVEYYLWSETEPKGFKNSDIGTLGDNITINVENGTETWSTSINYAGTESKVWNIEVVKLTNGEYLVTDPVLISQFGREILNITEYYLVTNQGSGVKAGGPEWITTPGTISAETPYLWNYKEITYTKHEPTITEPVIIGVWNKGEDGKSIGDIFEFYYYGEEGEYPTPDWENFEINHNIDGTIAVGVLNILNENGEPTEKKWLDESEYLECTDVKSCLWNLEVTVFKDSSDGYTHSSPCLLSNRAHEIVSVEEYYLATNQDSNVVFSEETIGDWTHVGANEPVPTTDASKSYLWNAELITYFNGEIKYTSPVRIGVWIKGDPGDPGDSAHIAELDFTNDIDNVSVNDEGKSLYTKVYSNTVSLIYDGKPITEGVTYDCSSDYNIDGLDYKFVDSVFNVTINKDCSLTDVQGNILQSLPFKLQATATIDGKEVTAIKNFTLFVFKNIPLVSLDTNVSRIYCDYEGYIYSDINAFEYEKVTNIETQEESRTKAFTIQSYLLGITIDDWSNYTVKLLEDGKVSTNQVSSGDDDTNPYVLAEVTINLNPANKVRLYRMQLETNTGIILDYSDIEINWGEAPKYFVDWVAEPFTVYHTIANNNIDRFSVDLNKEIKCIFTHNGIKKGIDPTKLYVNDQNIELLWTLNDNSLILSQIYFRLGNEEIQNNYKLEVSYKYYNDELKREKDLVLGYLNFNCVEYKPTFDLHTNSICLPRKYTEDFNTTYTVAYPIDYSCILKDVEYNDLTLDFADTQENSYITEAIDDHKLQLLKLYEEQYYLVATMEYGNSVNITNDPFYQIALLGNSSVNVKISTSKEVETSYKTGNTTVSVLKSFDLYSDLSLILTSNNSLRIKFAHKNAVIDNSDINQKLKWYFANLERDYISVDELYTLGYVCKYAIDVDENTPINKDLENWIELSEEHTENGLCTISTKHIVNNIIIAIFDQPGNLVWYEVVKRTTNTSVDIVDYFNNIPSKVSVHDPMDYRLLDTTYSITYEIDDSLGKTTGEANIKTSGTSQILEINRLQSGDIYLNAIYHGTIIATKIIHVENVMLESGLSIGSSCASATAGVVTNDKFSEYTVIHINEKDSWNFQMISLDLPGYVPNIDNGSYEVGDKTWLNNLIGRSIKLKFVFNGDSANEWFDSPIVEFGLQPFKSEYYGISYTSFSYVDNNGAADEFLAMCSSINKVYLNPDKSFMLEIVYKSVLFDSGNGYYDTAIIPYVYPIKSSLSTL